MAGSPYRASTRVLCGLVVLTGLSACVTQIPMSRSVSARLTRSGEATRVVLMPLKVELSEIRGSGLALAKADWTRDAKARLEKRIEVELSDRRVEVVRYVHPDGDPLREHLHHQIIELHDVVSHAMATQPDVRQRLPTKAEFEWTLGSEVRTLSDDPEADYALFFHLTEAHASSERVAALMVARILGGGGNNSEQSAYASLVELDSGRVFWFNRIERPNYGDTRDSSGAGVTIERLLRGFPE